MIKDFMRYGKYGNRVDLFKNIMVRLVLFKS